MFVVVVSGGGGGGAAADGVVRPRAFYWHLFVLLFSCVCVYVVCALMLTKTPFHNDHQSIATAKNNKNPSEWNKWNKNESWSFISCAIRLHALAYFVQFIYSLLLSHTVLRLVVFAPILYGEFIKLIYFCCSCCCCLFSFRIVGGITITELNGSATGLSKYWWCDRLTPKIHIIDSNQIERYFCW